MEKSKKLEIIKEAVKTFNDFPKEGIIFRDIFGVFQNVIAMRALEDLLVEHVFFLDVDAIVGLDSRGFLIGPLISLKLGKPFFPVRKKGKLPGKVIEQNYKLEYGEATIEVQSDVLSKGCKVVIVDDLLATGGTLKASIELLERIGAVVVECLVVIELISLKGREIISSPVHSLIQYD